MPDTISDPSLVSELPLLPMDLPGSTEEAGAAASPKPPRRARRGSTTQREVASSQRSADAGSIQLDAFPIDQTSPAERAERLEVVPTDKPGIVLVDPFAIEPEPFNARGLAVFDPERNRDLIDDMSVHGNTVPVRLRPRSDGQGWTCPSGSRRVNAARAIATEQPGFRVAAIIDAGMSDTEAYALCLADNSGRNEVTPLQRGREMKWAIEHLHGGDRQSYIELHRVDKSVVSRALDLANLPAQIVAAAKDPEALPTVFAEKLAPKLKIKAERSVIFARLKALKGERLPAARLLSYLLLGEIAACVPDRRRIQFGSGSETVSAVVTLLPDRSAQMKVPVVTRLTVEQKGELFDFIAAQLNEILSADEIT